MYMAALTPVHSTRIPLPPTPLLPACPSAAAPAAAAGAGAPSATAPPAAAAAGWGSGCPSQRLKSALHQAQVTHSVGGGWLKAAQVRQHDWLDTV